VFITECYIAIKFANRLLRRKKELEWFLLVRTFSRRKKSLAKQISKFPFCCRSAYIRRIQNLFLYFVRRFWRRLSSSNLSKLFRSNKSLLRFNAAIFFVFPAILDCGKQRAIRANYFAAKKSASREKIRKWKTGLILESATMPVATYEYSSFIIFLLSYVL
jgi:hypothetical protein